MISPSLARWRSLRSGESEPSLAALARVAAATSKLVAAMPGFARRTSGRIQWGGFAAGVAAATRVASSGAAPGGVR
jgi:hypothetical protein